MKNTKTLFARLFPLLTFRSSADYWERRYRMGGTSGDGSTGANASYKADVINDFVSSYKISSVVEFGCGDGGQLALLNIPHYVGIDVSRAAVDRCKQMYLNDPTKKFLMWGQHSDERAQLAISIDVVFHLVEDDVYHAYLSALLGAADEYVLIYSTDAEMKSTGVAHVRHRNVTKDIADRHPEFERIIDFEATLPTPIHQDRGHPVNFFAYRRLKQAVVAALPSKPIV